MITLFWISVFTVGYVYFGYPLVLYILNKVLPERKVQQGEIFPEVTLIISVYNEAATIEEKLKNALSLDYPKEKLEILVVSDASTDGSDDIIRGYQDQGIKLLRQEERAGKTLGLNHAVQKATGEIIVFSDANAMYEPDAVRKLVRNFNDPKVGYVTGESRYLTSEESSVSVLENLYWTYEIAIKKMESRLGSMVGADGAIYAIRNTLYSPLKSTDINDFVNPLQIIFKKYRGIYEPEAVCYEETASSFRGEFRRRVRIVSRSWRGLFRVQALLNPFRFGTFSLALISHKLLRWLVPVMMTTAFVSNIFLFEAGRIYQVLFGFQVLFVLMTLVGGCFTFMGWQNKIFQAPYYFTLSNVASLIGIYRGIRGTSQVTWEPERARASQTGLSGLKISKIGIFIFLACFFFFGLALKRFPSLAEITLWGASGVIVAVYVGYPFFLVLLSFPFRKKVLKETYCPTVSLLIAAYNEDQVIEEKIKNALALDYPKEKLKIVIGSDGSTDRTNEIIRKYEKEGVSWYAYSPRRGKVSVLNRTMPEIQTEVTVLSDANTMYDPIAIKKLVRNFADPAVGAVSGDVILQNDYIYYGKSEGTYYRYERFIQEKETELGSMVGVDGAMYAIRTELFKPPSDNIILDDFVISMNVAKQGYRIVYEPEALAYESGSTTTTDEFKRKVRVIAGAVQALKQGEGLPHFMEQPGLSLKYVFHKLFRWFIPVQLILLFMANLALLGTPIYQVFFLGQVIFYALAVVGLFTNIEAKGVFALPYYFCLVNLAALLGIIRGLADLQPVTWEKLERT